ncbi:TraR/DksA family transcriptional regulator [Neptuniibacter sp.]|uniref:TraR/DksA family transcriptional regulator n=1 Tax=Neptuniibacter sp. TaxID=1962643 RepID=UPI002628EA4F|nr:TraR/DksA family transcriptional regulator [Neptuniibacter sp.]MCP4598817.1 TraR/DksA family transcriptional regulator [Neptuniibacter sp.]
MTDFIDDVQVEQLLDKLHKLKHELDDEVDSLKHTAEPVKLDQQAFGRVSRGEALQQQNMAKANLGQCQERIRQVEEALRKIDSEDYGYCDSCGDEISLARLHAKPESPLCIGCQEQQEQS